MDIKITDGDIDIIEKELSLEFDDMRRNIIKDFRCIDVQACPGSGKTTLLGAKLLLMAQKWNSQDRGICVLSHTNVAKNEILKVLQKCSSGPKFMNYPHFIGTIQEFVDKFIALPMLRQFNLPEYIVDDDVFFERFKSSKTGIYNSLRSKSNMIDSYVRSLNYFIEGTCLKIEKLEEDISISDYWKNKIRDFKIKLLNKGILKYKEMYNFAFYAENFVKHFIVQRFPYVFIDEMQDTLKYQDDLLNDIFKGKSIVQRFGDPDQAIFANDEEAHNESYNTKQSGQFDYEINSTNRFNNCCNLIECFKIRKEKVPALLPSVYRLNKEQEYKGKFNKNTDFTHHIILYNNPSVDVLERYGEIIKNEYNNSSVALVHKAVGYVGKDKSGSQDLTIKHYWQEFDKDKNNIKFIPLYFLDVIKLLKSQKQNYYQYFLDTCIYLLRKNGKDISRDNLLKELKNNGKLMNLNKLYYGIITNPYPSNEDWNIIKKNIQNILSVNDCEFLNYVEYEPTKEVKTNSDLNIYHCKNGIDIAVGTIHSVKGETHDSTLVLETKYYKYDLSYFLNYPEANCYKQLKKEVLYVAASRPRHLLCLAVAKSRLPTEVIDKLKRKGWIIDEINN